MSWDRVLRSSQAVKTTVLSTMESRDFHSKMKKLGDLDDTSQTLHKDARQLTDKELEVYKSEKKLVTDLCNSPPLRDDPTLKYVLKEWNEYIKHQEESLSVMTVNMTKVMVEPMKRLLSEFPKVQASIKKRDQLLVEYDKWEQKVEKMMKKDRTGPNIVKRDNYKQQLKAAQEEFEAEDESLRAYMSSLHNLRTDYLLPSIHALIKLQISQIGEGFKGYTELQARMSSTDHTRKPDRFNEFKTLSIVSSVEL